MKLTLTPTETIDTINGQTGKVSARIWEGATDAGVPVKAWIAVIQPQTHDATLLEAFGRELKEVRASRELVSFDVRML